MFAVEHLEQFLNDHPSLGLDREAILAKAREGVEFNGLLVAVQAEDLLGPYAGLFWSEFNTLPYLQITANVVPALAFAVEVDTMEALQRDETITLAGPLPSGVDVGRRFWATCGIHRLKAVIFTVTPTDEQRDGQPIFLVQVHIVE